MDESADEHLENGRHVSRLEADSGGPPVDSTVLPEHQNLISVTGDAAEDATETTVRLSFWASYTKKEYFTLAILAISRTFSALFYSLLAPFFPTEAKEKGAGEIEIGFIFGSFQLIMFFISPVYGNYITKIGSRFMLISGILVTSACAVLFGFLAWCPDGAIFVGMCFAVRSVEALANAAQSTAALAIASHTFRGHVSTVMGILEATGSIGLMLGPLFGGLLYSAVFGCPFSSLVQHFSCVVSLPGYFCRTKKFHLSGVMVGLIFLIPCVIVVILAPIYGHLSDRWQVLSRPMMLVGNILGAVGFLLIGPSPILNAILPFLAVNAMWMIIVSLIVTAVGWGSMVLTYQQFVLAARADGFPDDLDTHGIISGVFNSFNSLGAMVGPVIGGILLDQIGFPWASTAMAGLITFSFLPLLAYMVCDSLKKCKRPIAEPPFAKIDAGC